MHIVSKTGSKMGCMPTSSICFKFDFMPIAAMEMTKAKRDMSVAASVIRRGNIEQNTDHYGH
jgi:hypothetical protein